MRRVWRVSHDVRVSVVRAFVAVMAVLASAGAAVAGGELPSFDRVRDGWRSSDAWLLDRDGRPLHRQRVDHGARRLDWIPLDEMSPALRAAIVLSEDRRFHQHSGVDWTAVAAASFRKLFDERTRGASTLTMQLAGLLDERLRGDANGRSLTQKVGQAWIATRLERRWRKHQILEAYLNLAPFRGELIGIDAASRTMFGKQPIGLDATESAVLAALLRGPNADADRVGRRACALLRELRGQRASPPGRPAAESSVAPVVDCLAVEGVARLALARRAGAADLRLDGAPQIAAHLARQMLTGAGPQRVGTVRADLQRVAHDALRRHLSALARRNVEDGAVLVLDNRSGEVLAWVGSSGPLSSAAAVDGVTALRQAGSTLKPFLYALAIERRLLTAASLLDDSPVDLATATGLYIPRNYDRGFKGLVSLRAALGASLNVPAVRTLVLVTPDALVQRMRALGFDSLVRSGDWYGYSLALGSADVSLLELTNAYRALANGGRYGPAVRVRDDVTPAAPGEAAAHTGPRPDARRAAPGWRDAGGVVDPAAAFIVADVLADRNARALTFGTENTLALRGWAAVKTGTSKDMRDNWCIGFTDRYTVGVWVGNFSGEPMWNVSGMSGAAPVWADVTNWLHRGEASRPPSPPAGVIGERVVFESGLEPPRAEWFVRGTELGQVARVERMAVKTAIVAPVDASLYALDPDIPPASQRLTFVAEGERAAAAHWVLDGRSLGHGARLGWAPLPGRHRLELRHGDELLATVSFEVRGARLRGGPPPARPTRLYGAGARGDG